MGLRRKYIPAVFSSRNFSRLYAGQILSMLGDSFYSLTLLWMTQELTRSSPFSALWLGMVVGSGYIARVFVGPVAGALVDRWSKRKVMVASDVIRGALLAVLSALFLSHMVHVWILMVFHFVLAGVGTFFSPANISLLRRIVPEEHLLQANSISNTTQKTCEFLGPGICGLLIGWVGMTPALVFDCLSFLVSVVSLLFVHVEETNIDSHPISPTGIVHDMGDGLRTLISIPFTRMIVPFMLAYNVAVTAFEVLLVVFIGHVLHIHDGRGATVLGLFQSSMALGDIAGGFLTGPISKRVRTEHMIAGSMAIGSILLFLTGFTHSMALMCIYVFVISMSIMVSGITFTTTMQLMIPKERLGRVWALLSAAFNASIPISQIAYTSIAAGIPISHLFNGIGMIGASIAGLAFVNPALHRRRHRPDSEDSNQSESLGS